MSAMQGKFERENPRYGTLRSTKDVLQNRPEVEAGIASIAAAIDPAGILSKEMLVLVDFKVAATVGCPA